MNDVNVVTLTKKYGEIFGHIFSDSASDTRCSRCGIVRNEFNRKISGLGKRTTIAVLCDKTIEEIQENKKVRPRKIQNITKDEFLSLLMDYHQVNPFGGKPRWVHSFKDTYEWFWNTHKINRSTVAKMFVEIYNEPVMGIKNKLRVYGSPTGVFKDEDRLPMTHQGRYREWSLWGVDNFELFHEQRENKGN